MKTKRPTTKTPSPLAARITAAHEDCIAEDKVLRIELAAAASPETIERCRRHLAEAEAEYAAALAAYEAAA